MTIKIDTRPMFIVPYFGKFPIWFPANLLSCEMNPGFRWLFFTDIDPPQHVPDNVSFVPMTLDELSSLASERLGSRVSLLRPYKVCDLKPAFGEVFSDWLQDCSFWGYCDIDIIWGKIASFYPLNDLESFDVVSGAFNIVRGHFVLFRNERTLKRLYRHIPDYLKLINTWNLFYPDEHALTSLISTEASRGNLRVAWNRWLYNYPPNRETGIKPSRIPFFGKYWTWEQGKLFFNNSEIMYLHFMTWKDTMRHCSIKYGEHPSTFSIHYYGIRCPKTYFPPTQRFLAFKTAAWRTIRRSIAWRVERLLNTCRMTRFI